MLVSAWLHDGAKSLHDVVSKVKLVQIPHSPEDTIRNAIQTYAMLSLCPNVSSRFAASFSRNRGIKMNLGQRLVSSVLSFNTNRKHMLRKVYESLSCRAEYCEIMKAMEHAKQVKCFPVHDVGENIWSSYSSKVLVTCMRDSNKKRSWLVERNSVNMFRSFFRIRHFHAEVGMIFRWWLKSINYGCRENLPNAELLQVVNKFTAARGTSLLKNYIKSFEELQRTLYAYI